MNAQTLSQPWSSDPLTRIWNPDHHAWEALNPGVNTGYPGQAQAWGPEVEFAREFRAKHPGETLWIVKSAYGGTGLAQDTGQYVADWSPHSPGELFDTTTEVIRQAREAAGGVKIDALFWGQGEEDASYWEKAQAYAQNLPEFVAAARTQWLQDAAGKVGLFLISTEPGFSSAVRSAEASEDASDANVLSVDADAFPRQPDHTHFTAAGFDSIGGAWERMLETWRNPAAAPGDQPVPAEYQPMFRNILRADSASDAAREARVAVAGDLAAGGGAQNVIADLVHAAAQTTSVATLAYEFFTGRIPSEAGVDYLVAPAGPNANNLNAPYYQHFNIENRYINFAVNLGVGGEGHASFQSAYGGLSLWDTLKHAYGTIFGATPSDEKAAAILTPARIDYLASYGGDGQAGLGTKAALVGYLLAEAVKADVGTYAHANDRFLADLADGATFSVDLVGVYSQPGDVFHS